MNHWLLGERGADSLKTNDLSEQSVESAGEATPNTTRRRQRGSPRPRVINVDGHPAYARAIAELQESGDLGRRCRCRPSPYLNNVIEQDHRFIKKRIAASLWFRSAEGALRTIDGYEAMHLIRKGQIRWLPKGDVVGQQRFSHNLFGIAAWFQAEQRRSFTAPKPYLQQIPFADPSGAAGLQE
jgi:DDE domain